MKQIYKIALFTILASMLNYTINAQVGCNYTTSNSTDNTYEIIAYQPNIEGQTINFPYFLSPETEYQAGDLIVFQAEEGKTYNINTCGLVSWDTQITILEYDGTSPGLGIAYDDDGCSGLQSNLTFTAPATTQYAIFVNRYNCNTSNDTFTFNFTCLASNTPEDETLTECPGTLSYLNYQNNDDVSWYICPAEPFTCLELTFTYLNTEAGYDFVTIYEGDGTDGTELGEYDGTIVGTPPIQANSCVTVQFTSDGSVTRDGFSLEYTCYDTECPEPPPAIEVNNESPWTNANTYTELWFGNCISVQNATITGVLNQSGYFSNGDGIGLSEGLILSTGYIQNVVAPNSTAAGSGSPNLLGDITNDSDINTIASATESEDCVIFSFDFQPLSTAMSFDFVFASEAFTFSNAGNDAFGIFLSGPGITGTFSNNAINLATLPNDNAVTVNNIANTEYYNTATTNITELNGHSDVITATYSSFKPCGEYYTLELKLCDVSDGDYDSAVFLQANSFDLDGGTVGTAPTIATLAVGSPTIYEDCNQSFMTIKPDPSTADFTQDIIINLLVDASADQATYTTDYTLSGTSTSGGNLTGTFPNFTFTIPANSLSSGESDTLFITPVADATVEGAEPITIQTTSFECVCDFPISVATTNIQEVDFTESLTLSTINVCPDATSATISLTLEITGTNPNDDYTYIITDSGGTTVATGNGINVNETLNKPSGGWDNFTLTFTDGCGRQVGPYTIDIQESSTPDATINTSAPNSFCELDDDVNFSSYVSSAGGTWTTDPVCDPPCIDENTGIFSPSDAGAQDNMSIEYSLNSDCGSATGSYEIDVTASQAANITAPTGSPFCSDNVGTVDFTATPTAGTWSANCGSCINSSSGQFSLSNVGTHTVTYTPTGCYIPDTETITVTQTQNANIVGPSDGTLCADETFNFTASPAGGTWSATCGSCINSSGQFSATDFQEYIITYTLGTCGNNDTETITVGNCCSGQILFIGN